MEEMKHDEKQRKSVIRALGITTLLLIMLTSAVSATDNLVLDPGGAYVTVSPSANPSVVGQYVTFTIHVDLLYLDDTGGRHILPAPGGTVQFCTPSDTHRISDTAQVQNGIATITTNCFSYEPPYQTAPGTYSMLVAYVGLPVHDHSHIITQTVVEKNEIPEFPSIAVPVVAVLGLIAIVERRKE